MVLLLSALLGIRAFAPLYLRYLYIRGDVVRCFLSILGLGLLFVNPVLANSDEQQEASAARAAFGVGIGYPSLLHLDYQRRMMNNMSWEIGLTPMLMHNVVSIAVTKHVDLNSTASSDTDFLVSGMWTHIVNIGGIAGGPGVRVGVERMSQRSGYSLTGGPLVVIGGEFNGDLLFDIRLTRWKLKN